MNAGMNTSLVSYAHHFITQPVAVQWTERLGWTLVHFLWEGLLIAALYAAARIWQSKSSTPSTPQARYLLGCAALLAMIAAPLVTFGILHPPRPVPIPTPYFRHAPAAPTSAFTPHAPSVTVFEPDVPYSAETVRRLTWFVLFWLAGAIVFSLRLMGGWLVASRMGSKSLRPAPPQWQSALNRLRTRIGLTRSVRLMVSALVEVPTVVGWLRPLVLVPVAALSGLPPDHVEALLLHELAHIRRHDYLVNILQSVCEALLFYHPAVWWISRHIRIERELCCDDLAVSISGDVLTYTCALTELESYRPRRATFALAASDGSLSHRVSRLLGVSPQPQSGLAGLILSTLLLIVSAFGVFAQSANTRPVDDAFEVATIKPDPRPGKGVNMLSAHRLQVFGSLRYAVMWAYNTSSDLVTGGPDWVDAQTYNLIAESPNILRPGAEENMSSMQKVLVDRFHLKIHRVPKTVSVYNLIVAKDGPKPALHPSASQVIDPHFGPQGRGNFTLKVTSSPLGRFCALLMRRELVDRPCIDKTGLPGIFDFDLTFDNRNPLPADSDQPDLSTAFEEQLGLKLESGKGTLDEIVIDSAERPSEY